MNYIKPLIATLVLTGARCGYEDIPNPRTGKQRDNTNERRISETIATESSSALSRFWSVRA